MTNMVMTMTAKRINYFIIPGIIRDPVELVCNVYKVSKTELLSKSQEQKLIEPRQIGMFYANRVLKLSLSKAGAKFNRDHATVMNARRQIRNFYETEKDFKQRLTDFLKLTNNDQEIEKFIYGDSMDRC